MQYNFHQLSKALEVLKVVPTPLEKNGQMLRKKRQLKSDLFLKAAPRAFLEISFNIF